MAEMYDVIIIGTGAGGGTLAVELAPSGKRILLLERGGWLPRERQNWDVGEVFVENRYISKDTWYDKDGKPFQPGGHYFVGGATKMYGAALYRLRERDFGELRHHDGISPAWPISYADMEPYYTRAENLYQVHGARGEDPTEPPASAPYPHPAVSHEPRIQQLHDDLAKAGFRPFHSPCGIMLNEGNMPFSKCIRCMDCDGFPCLVHAKADAEVIGVRPAMQFPNVTLLTNARAMRLLTNATGTAVTEVIVDRDGVTETLPGRGRRGVLWRRKLRPPAARVGQRQAPAWPRQRIRSGGPQLHVPQQHRGPRSVEGAEPDALPEDAGPQRLLLQRTGRRLSARQPPDARQVAGADVPGRKRDGQAGTDVDAGEDGPPRARLLAVHGGPAEGREPRHDGARRRPPPQLHEDQPGPGEDALRAVQVDAGAPRGAHAPVPRDLYLKNEMDITAVAHQAGTCRFGKDPKTSVLDVNCKAHELDNLYVVDTSFFPSIGAVNPGLTAIANALRVGDHLRQRL